MNTLERVMRVMTHINIGATLGTGVWILWSGLMIVGAPLHAATERPAALRPSGQPAGTSGGTGASNCEPCRAPEAHPGHHHEGRGPMSGHGLAVTPRSDT